MPEEPLFSPTAKSTENIVFQIRHAPKLDASDIEEDLGRLLVRNLPILAEYLGRLTEQERFAAISLLLGHIRATITEIEIAAETIAPGGQQ